MASPSGTGREYPPELVHGEMCRTRFNINADCDCGKSEPAAAPSGTGHDTAVYEPEGYPACPFCGSETNDAISSAMREGHEAVEKLCGSDPGSEAFHAALADVRSFVGCECEPDPPVAVPGLASGSPAENDNPVEYAARMEVEREQALAASAADPVVSPADTIRDIFGYARFMANLGGADTVALADCDKADAALAALLAVGERDKADASAHTSLRVELARIFGPVKPREGQTWNAAMLKRIADVLAAEEDSRERDRQHIARLTEALREIVEAGHYRILTVEEIARARAVLAGEEDAGEEAHTRADHSAAERLPELQRPMVRPALLSVDAVGPHRSGADLRVDPASDVSRPRGWRGRHMSRSVTTFGCGCSPVLIGLMCGIGALIWWVA